MLKDVLCVDGCYSIAYMLIIWGKNKTSENLNNGTQSSGYKKADIRNTRFQSNHLLNKMY